MISFTVNVKNEVASEKIDREDALAFLSGFIRTNGKISDNSLAITTENSKVIKLLYVLLEDIYNISLNITNKENNFNRNRLYIINIQDKLDFILKDLAIIDNDNNYLDTVPNYLLDSEIEKKAYLKGVFLACGSINDPKTSRYHLEFFVERKEEANFINNLLNSFFLNSKVILKDKKYMIYIKEAEKIGDFLRIIEANQAVMYYEDIRIYRDHKNMTNRLNNMEQANIEKTINTCNNQIEDINTIYREIGKDILDNKLQEAAIYRLKYPESSLQELSEIMTLEIGKPITKSGLNHRFRKLKEIANNLKGGKE